MCVLFKNFSKTKFVNFLKAILGPKNGKFLKNLQRITFRSNFKHIWTGFLFKNLLKKFSDQKMQIFEDFCVCVCFLRFYQRPTSDQNMSVILKDHLSTKECRFIRKFSKSTFRTKM